MADYQARGWPAWHHHMAMSKRKASILSARRSSLRRYRERMASQSAIPSVLTM